MIHGLKTSKMLDPAPLVDINSPTEHGEPTREVDKNGGESHMNLPKDASQMLNGSGVLSGSW